MSASTFEMLQPLNGKEKPPAPLPIRELNHTDEGLEEMPPRNTDDTERLIEVLRQSFAEQNKALVDAVGKNDKTPVPTWFISILASVVIGLFVFVYLQDIRRIDKLEALIDKLETYNQHSREQFALHGWIIDEFGNMTPAQPPLTLNGKKK